MNKVYLSGLVASQPTLTTGEVPHLVYDLSVIHRTAKNETRRELYRVNAWNGPAQWGYQNLRLGGMVALQGYLTQHTTAGESGHTVRQVEVTAEEFIVGAKLKRVETVQPESDAPVQPETSEAEAVE